jgi:hypothetical protein
MDTCRPETKAVMLGADTSGDDECLTGTIRVTSENFPLFGLACRLTARGSSTGGLAAGHPWA